MGADVPSPLTFEAERKRHIGHLTIDALVEQWDTTRDVYVILNGTFTVRDDERELVTAGPGDFTDELAAIDWGAGYGTVRAAEVRATTACKLLVLTPALLREVLSRSAAARELVERTARNDLR